MEKGEGGRVDRLSAYICFINDQLYVIYPWPYRRADSGVAEIVGCVDISLWGWVYLSSEIFNKKWALNGPP
jgi:hypothetical protein